MAITSDNKILFTGGAYVFHGDTRYFLMKLDTNGDTLWFKTDDPTGLLSEGYAVKEISNGNYVVAVKKYSAHTCLYIVVYDANGNLLSQQAYLDTLDLGICNFFENNGYLFFICNRIISSQYQTRIVKTDLFGNFISTYIDTTFRAFEFTSSSCFQDNSFLVTGISLDSSSNFVQPIVAKLDFNGNLLWKKSYPLPGNVVGRQICSINNGDFLFAASSSSNIEIFKIDSLGNEIWHFPLPLLDYSIISPDSSRFLVTSGELTLHWYDTNGSLINSQLLSIPLNVDLTKTILHDEKLYYCGINSSGSTNILNSSFLAIVTDSTLINRIPQQEINIDQIYPSICVPGQTIYFTGTTNSKLSVQIYDLQGKVIDLSEHVQNVRQGKYSFKLSDSIEEGIYIISITSNNSVSRSKLYIN